MALHADPCVDRSQEGPPSSPTFHVDFPRQSYQSLAAQVATRIAGEIEAGKWIDWLPGERALTDSLQVSRKTIRRALARLKHEGRISTTHGQGHRILESHPLGRHVTGSVGLLTADTVDRLRPFTTLWVTDLRAMLVEQGVRFTTYSGQRFFSSRADTELARLVRQNPQACWVLAHTDERIQQWFHEQRVPCLIAGSSHPILRLPSVDLDYRAVCRHAVTAMHRHGHRRVALLVRESQRAGDLESEAGFLEAAQRVNPGAMHAVVARHDDTLESTLRALRQLFDRVEPPTAVLVADPTCYLTTVSFLASRRLRVGPEVSLVSRDTDAFLTSLIPAPTRYSCSPHAYAKRLLPFLLALARGETITGAKRIVPKFIAGESLVLARR